VLHRNTGIVGALGSQRAAVPVGRATIQKAPMNLFQKSTHARSGARTLAWGAVALGVLALANHAAARLAERRHPPAGSFLEIDGVRLHYTDRGTGQPVVLIHGNAVTGDDYNTSGVADLLLAGHRVIIFDRPGFGYSERPHGRLWTANEQAELLHKALRQLGVERPVMVGHSWGAIVALALAEAHPDDTAALLLLSGYYFWTLRPDVLPVTLGALPVVGDILRYTISPLFGWLTMPLFKRILFSPAPVPARFQAEYSPAMALRPSQIRATSMDGALMIPGALSLRGGYEKLSMPVVIMAGDGDKVVFKRSAERLHASIKGSVLRIVKGAGHMVHHLAPGQVAATVEAIAATSREQAAAPKSARAIRAA
jgi:pimeloyl-ACP methyl ester carboxylesterase